MVVSSELANSPCSRLLKQKSSAPLRDHRCGQVTWQVHPLLWSSHLAGTGHMGSRSGEAVSVDAPLLVQSSSATLPNLSPNLSRPQLWSSHQAGAHERQAFGHCCGRVAKLALERRRVQQRCPRAPTPEPGKGRRPKNRQSQRRKVFLPGCSVFSLSWPACAWAFLVPGRWFSGPAPSGSCLFLFRLMFHLYWPRASRSSSQREERRVKRSGTDPSTGFFRYFLCTTFLRMFPSRGELSQHEVLFYMVCPTFSSHSLRYWYCIEKAIISKISFCRWISSRQQRQPPSYRPCLRGMISTLPGQLPSRGRRLLRNLSV